MADKVTPQEYWKNFPEAPASDTAKWVDTQGFEHMTTIRSWSISGLATQLAEFYDDVKTAGGHPANEIVPPKTHVPERDETGVAVIDGQTGEPRMVPLPEGVGAYTVKAVYYDKTQSGKDVLKVLVHEEAAFINKKYGVNCFKAPSQYSDFKSWIKGEKYGPKDGAMTVIIRAPQGDSKYPDVIEFR